VQSPAHGVAPEGVKEKEDRHTSIRIRVRAFVDNNIVPKYEVLGIRGVLPYERLPLGYVSSAPSFWLTKSRRTIKLFDGRTLGIGGIYRKPVFERFITDIARAGDRLHEINGDKRVPPIIRSKFEGTRTVKI